MKRCLYCLRQFDGRGRCCSEWCARRITGRVAWITRSRREASARIMADVQRQVRHVPRFRLLAMGGDQETLLPAIFGTMPAPITPKHGETLDAGDPPPVCATTPKKRLRSVPA